MCLWLRFDSDDEHLGLPVCKTTCKTLILISFGAFHTHALPLSHYRIRAHVRFFVKHQGIGTHTIFLGNLHQVRDGDVQFSTFDEFVLLEGNVTSVGNFLCRKVEHLAQSTQALSYLLQLIIHSLFNIFWVQVSTERSMPTGLFQTPKWRQGTKHV